MYGLTNTTADLARTAIHLHRLATAADEAQDLRSPATGRDPREVSRPTEETALCPRREHLRTTADNAAAQLRKIQADLNLALAHWEGDGPAQ